MNKSLKFILMLVASIITGWAILAITHCCHLDNSVKHGIITNKTYYPAHWIFIWISHGKYGGHMQPVYISDAWHLNLCGLDEDHNIRNVTLYVSHLTYDQTNIGTQWDRE